MFKLKSSSNFILILLLTASCAKAQKPCGFKLNEFDERVSWKDKAPITLYIHESVPQEFRDEVIYAAKVWNYKKTLLLVSDKIITGPIGNVRDNQNVIYYIDNNSVTSANTQGVTNFRYLGDQILDTDIVINAFNFKYFSGTEPQSDEISMRSLLIHEMGHALGLQHVKDSKDVMYPYLSYGINRLELTDYDKQSLECEY